MRRPLPGMPGPVGIGGGEGNGRLGSMGSSRPGMKEPKRVRSEFPETWLWSDTVMG